MNKEFDIKKYPKSKKNFQCIGPCYYPNTMVVHPTNLEIVTEPDNPFCPVGEWQSVDNITGKVTSNITDGCYNPTEKTNISSKELELSVLTPYIDFNVEHFLKIYYKIYSFEDSINWIDSNKHVPINTKMRIINSSLKIFGDNIDIFDNRFADFFIEYIKRKHIGDLYNKLSGYINIDEKNDSVSLSKDVNNFSDQKQHKTEKVNYIIKTFLDKDDIVKFLVRYFKHRKNEWKDIEFHLENMLNDFLSYSLNKIIKTLQK